MLHRRRAVLRHGVPRDGHRRVPAPLGHRPDQVGVPGVAGAKRGHIPRRPVGVVGDRLGPGVQRGQPAAVAVHLLRAHQLHGAQVGGAQGVLQPRPLARLPEEDDGRRVGEPAPRAVFAAWLKLQPGAELGHLLEERPADEDVAPFVVARHQAGLGRPQHAERHDGPPSRQAGGDAGAKGRLIRRGAERRQKGGRVLGARVDGIRTGSPLPPARGGRGRPARASAG